MVLPTNKFGESMGNENMWADNGSNTSTKNRQVMTALFACSRIPLVGLWRRVVEVSTLINETTGANISLACSGSRLCWRSIYNRVTWVWSVSTAWERLSVVCVSIMSIMRCVSLVLLLVFMALLHFSTAQYYHDRRYQPVYGQGYYQDNYGYRPTYGHGYQQYYDDGLYGRHRYRY
ncbi:uncharacterized protein [Procambarus clarkii]|uniref:uncharacterized protein n=1 Tax=Procambarus clarkii TaxID=6728 RepID=UPI00374326D9